MSLRRLLVEVQRMQRAGREGYCPVSGKPIRTRRENDDWLANYRASKPRHAPRMRGYDCSHCGGWHATSMTRKKWEKVQ